APIAGRGLKSSKIRNPPSNKKDSKKWGPQWDVKDRYITGSRFYCEGRVSCGDWNHRPLGYEPNGTTLTRCDSAALNRPQPRKGPFKCRVLVPNWWHTTDRLVGSLPHRPCLASGYAGLGYTTWDCKCFASARLLKILRPKCEIRGNFAQCDQRPCH